LSPPLQAAPATSAMSAIAATPRIPFTISLPFLAHEIEGSLPGKAGASLPAT
jgi:hypothetical protein